MRKAPVPAPIVIQPSGKIVAAGGNSGDFALARFDPMGRWTRTSVAMESSPRASARPTVYACRRVGCRAARPAGSLRPAHANGEFALARYELDGDLDPGFSGDGILITDIGHEYAAASSIAVQPDGRIVVGGSAYSYILDYTASYGASGSVSVEQRSRRRRCRRSARLRRPLSPDLRSTTQRWLLPIPAIHLACIGDVPQAPLLLRLRSRRPARSTTRVRVFKIKRGGRRVKVASGTPDYDPDQSDWSYGIRTNRTRGRYFAKLRRELTPGGWCSRAKSPVLRLRRR